MLRLQHAAYAIRLVTVDFVHLSKHIRWDGILLFCQEHSICHFGCHSLFTLDTGLTLLRSLTGITNDTGDYHVGWSESLCRATNDDLVAIEHWERRLQLLFVGLAQNARNLGLVEPSECFTVRLNSYIKATSDTIDELFSVVDIGLISVDELEVIVELRDSHNNAITLRVTGDRTHPVGGMYGSTDGGLDTVVCCANELHGLTVYIAVNDDSIDDSVFGWDDSVKGNMLNSHRLLPRLWVENGISP